MKVCTDACLFGALVANSQVPAAHCLDIGAGTGLLSLMYAQKDPLAIIDGVEIDNAAAEQANENFAASPWAGRLNIINADILDLPVEKKYGLIISNPPFFEDDLQSPDPFKNSAKNNTTLGLKQLLETVKKNLTAEGSFAVLLPYQRVDYFIGEAAKSGLYLTEQVLVKQTGKHEFFRGILFFSKKNCEQKRSEVIIKDTAGKYTPAFTSALKDYYLHL